MSAAVSKHDAPARPAAPTLAQATLVWAKIALLSFGGPAGQIALMHKELVEERRWIGEERFLHALNFCMLLPGPEAQQLATYIGWLTHRTAGGLIAGVLFILPGVVAIMALSWIYALYGQAPAIEALFFGLKAAVIAIVFEAVLRLGKRALRSDVMLGIAGAAFLALFAFRTPFPLVVLAAAVIGYVGGRADLPAFRPGERRMKFAAAEIADADAVLGEEAPGHARPRAGWSLKIGAAFLALWLAPVAALMIAFGPGEAFRDIAVFFSKMAVVGFGGAYAALAYVAQQAVEAYGWLKPGEMLDGLGMAETTPGPLILVTQFVGFMGAFRDPGSLPPLLAGTLGGLLAVWVTFAPCFLWIFLGAPYVETLRGDRALSAALAAIAAAVVGVILNLAVWFAMHALFGRTVALNVAGVGVELPALASVRPAALLLTALAVVAVFRFKAGVLTVLAGCSALGVLFGAAGGLG